MSEPLDEPVKAELVELPQPPLSISHLMLWIFGAAVVLGVYRWFASLSEMTPAMRTVMVGSQLSFSLLAGINIAAVIIYTRRAIVRDARLLVQPGHWILAIDGVVNLFTWLLYGVAATVRAMQDESGSPELTWSYFSLPYALGCALALILNVLAVALQRQPLRWRFVFLSSAIFSGVLSLIFMTIFVACQSEPPGMELYSGYQWFSCVYSADQIVAIILLLFNLIADRADRAPRDWVHRVGVVAAILQSIASLAIHWLMQWAATVGP